MSQPDDSNYGHRFLDEFRELGGRLGDWSPSVVNELERADRERVISLLKGSGDSTDRIVQCAMSQTPAELARVVMDELATMTAAASAGTEWWPFLIL